MSFPIVGAQARGADVFDETRQAHSEERLADSSERVVVDFRTEPSRYKHWKLGFDGRVATLAMDVQEDGGLRPGYELKLNSYDLGVDIELYDAVQRLRFEHPEVRRGRADLGQGARLLRRRQHPHAEPVRPRVEGELLQVHQRDAQRHRGGDGGVAPGLPLRRQRPLRGRRLRAGAGDRPHHHGRRRLHDGGAARAAAARRAAGHGRAHAARGQAARAPRPRRLLLHARGGHQGPARRRVAARRRGRAALPARGDGEAARGRARRAHRPARDARGHRAPAARADDRRRPHRLPPRDLRDRPGRGRRRDHRRRARAPPPAPTSPPSTPPAPTSGRSPWRASSTT